MNRGLDNLRPFLIHLRRERGLVMAATVMALVVTALNLTVPLLFKRLYDLLDPSSGLPVAERLHGFGITIGVVMVVFVVRRTCQSGSSYLAMNVTQRVAVAVRRDIYQHLQRLPLEFYDDQRTGTLVSKITNDVTALQYLMHDGMVQLFTAPVTVVGAVVLVCYLDPVLGAVALAIFPLLYLVIRRTRGHLRRVAEENQANLALLTTQFLEAVSNIRIVRAFRREEYEAERFERRNLESLELRLRNARLSVLVEFVAEMIVLVGFAVILWAGGLRIAAGEINVGTLIALVALLQTMRTSLNMLSIAYTRYQQAVGAARRLLEILAEPPRPERVVAPPPAREWRGALRLREVTFAYPDGTLVLDGASAEIRAGETVGLIGESGIGKSTVASLILGLYEPQGGRIELDSVPLAEIPPDLLLDLVSVVPQDVGLFSGTVRENIAYARLDATDDEIVAAAKAANAHGFISRLAAGYDTPIGDRGVKLSGGQRQRIAIARAILRNPRLLILDEATSHVDPETEALVQEALARLMADRTTLVIAHQRSALREVDRVLILQGGKIVEADA